MVGDAKCSRATIEKSTCRSKRARARQPHPARHRARMRRPRQQIRRVVATVALMSAARFRAATAWWPQRGPEDPALDTALGMTLRRLKAAEDTPPPHQSTRAGNYQP